MNAWRETARALDALGATTGQIAAMCGVSRTSVLRLLDPAYAERQRKASTAATARRAAADEDYRARRRAYLRAAQTRSRQRQKERAHDVFQ